MLLLWSVGTARATMPPASGHVPPELSNAFERGLFEVEAHPPGTTTSAAPRVWRIPIIRVAYTDSALVFPRITIERVLFDTTGAVPTGSMTQYYRWVSGGRIEIQGEVVATVTVPHERNYYAYDAWGVDALGTPNNSYGLFRDAINACDATVDFSRFDLDNDGYVDMLWIVHAGPGGENTTSRRDLWSITSRATGGWSNAAPLESNDLMRGSLTQRVLLDRFTILPELSSFRPGQHSEIGVFCHEFGHTLGLPDLYDTSSLGGAANSGPGLWSLMSTGAFGGDGRSPESPAHLGAWCSIWLGWADRFRPTQDTTLVLPPIIDGAPVLEVWFQGEASSEHYLIENRVREGFDRKLLSEGLIITQVDEAVVGAKLSGNRINTGPTPGLRVLEADGQFDLVSGANRGDASDPFLGLRGRKRIDDFTVPSTRTFQGAPTNIALEQITPVGRDVRLRVRVRAAGWAVPALLAPGTTALPESNAGRRSAIAPDGRAWRVSCELRGNRAAVVLRERGWRQDWQSSITVDGGAGEAVDATLAWLGNPAGTAGIGNDDLALAWTDVTGAVSQIAYRARIRGRWLPVSVLTRSTEGCYAPAIAADARGRVYLTWLELLEGLPSLRFMQFLYTAPYGQPRTVTTPSDLPSAPTITAAGDGHAYVVWPNGGLGLRTIMACRFHPDSGLSKPFRLAPASAYSQPSVSAVVDSGGVLHSVWQVATGGGDELHYQRRQPAGRPSQRDTTIEALGSGQQNPTLALDPLGGVHLAYERRFDAGQRVLYKHWRPDIGWDHRGTEISDDTDLNTTSVELLPTSWGNVTVLWTGSDGSTTSLRQRERSLDGEAVTSAPPAGVVPGLTLGPNPLRAGDMLVCAGARLSAGDVLELFDAAGRRVAEATTSGDGRARITREATRGLASGLYFARVRGRDVHGRVVVLR